MYRVNLFNNISDIIFDTLDKETYETGTDLADYDLALVRSADLLDAEFPSSLLAVARAGAGTNNIPLDRCSEEGIVVFNTPGANANAVKELVLCGMLLAGRDIVGGNRWLRERHAAGDRNIDVLMEKAKKRFVGREISGKKLGVVGLGAIGILVANMGIDMHMDVLGCDPFLSVNNALRLSRKVQVTSDPDELFSTCDYITLHIPQNKDTKGMVDTDVFAIMKKDAVLLNFARGGLVDEEALIDALENGGIGAYVTDFPDDRLLDEEGVIALPHLGASTPEAEENCAAMAAEELDRFVKYGIIKNSVNMPEADIPMKSRYRITVINRNVTNMVGQFASLLAADGVNIDHMFNSSRGDWAYSVIDTGTPPDDETVRAIEDIEGVARVRVIG